MSRFLSMSFFTTILVLANLLLVSSALQSHDVNKSGSIALLLTKDDIVSSDELPEFIKDSRFIGDLEIGQRRAGEVTYQRKLDIPNETNDVLSLDFSFSVENGIIHYVRILNEPGSYAAVCDKPYSLGTSKSYFTARVKPISRSSLTIFAAAH